MFDEPAILLAEDREDDVVLIRRAFARVNFLTPLLVVKNGEEAISYFKGEPPYNERAKYPLPVLLLLDLKMPRKDGFEVLRWIRQQRALDTLRVLVLTSSAASRDVNLAYQLGANSFLVKPSDFNDLVQLTKFIDGFWLQFNKTMEHSEDGVKSSTFRGRQRSAWDG
jgi:CheY-like chemotaxis protein